MPSLQDFLINWADELEQYRTPSWNTFPDIDLYMDQVITWLERQMGIFSQQDGEKPVTPSMINNYVKNQVIPRPVQKKYTRDHLAYLIAVLNLKQVLSLSDITKLIAKLTSEKDVETIYEQFAQMQVEALRITAERVKKLSEMSEGEPDNQETEEKFCNLALKLSLEANSYSMAAKAILNKITVKKEKAANGKDREKSEKGKA
ncbi:MAG TPA: hypothetical protein DD738_04175 [Ruminiclostridium sp.]|jgi:hypothetical protein|nr:hypothetical protein [Ruminiclostridium sp.]